MYPSYICAVFSRFSRVQLCDPIECSLSGSSVHEILQARILEWAFSLVAESGSYSLDVVCRFLIVVASLVAMQGC